MNKHVVLPSNDACKNRPPLVRRPLLQEEECAQLAALFKVFANPYRLRLLHALARAGEIRVGDLAAALGLKVQAVSNQLQRLADQGFVAARREGQNMFYRIINPCVPEILDHGLCLVETTGR
jgi:DNA-binding transcriptional ArsR family regulator